MNEPNRTQWQIRCAFNGFCKRALKNEAMNTHRDTKQRQLREITAKLLAEALYSLQDEKRETVLLYYFFDMSEREIATYCNIPRTTARKRVRIIPICSVGL